ncbi:hypothetical protein G5I_13284 [Acromyrmex echinatior]|uniref:Uncharacterized protein n=1 Tax=Acromyrmex echinatior TaxID=103372 RepID=F4X4L8_ACREC|nr:hypothetical protein G5I_13284 [Acromyrmex echinatior]
MYKLQNDPMINNGARALSSVSAINTESSAAAKVLYPFKEREERTWLWNLLLDDERGRMFIETLDIVYEDMESLTMLDVANTM